MENNDVRERLAPGAVPDAVDTLQLAALASENFLRCVAPLLDAASADCQEEAARLTGSAILLALQGETAHLDRLAAAAWPLVCRRRAVVDIIERGATTGDPLGAQDALLLVDPCFGAQPPDLMQQPQRAAAALIVSTSAFGAGPDGGKEGAQIRVAMREEPDVHLHLRLRLLWRLQQGLAAVLPLRFLHSVAVVGAAVGVLAVRNETNELLRLCTLALPDSERLGIAIEQVDRALSAGGDLAEALAIPLGLIDARFHAMSGVEIAARVAKLKNDGRGGQGNTGTCTLLARLCLDAGGALDRARAGHESRPQAVARIAQNIRKSRM
jgi:hypothetical protein